MLAVSGTQREVSLLPASTCRRRSTQPRRIQARPKKRAPRFVTPLRRPRHRSEITLSFSRVCTASSSAARLRSGVQHGTVFAQYLHQAAGPRSNAQKTHCVCIVCFPRPSASLARRSGLCLGESSGALGTLWSRPKSYAPARAVLRPLTKYQRGRSRASDLARFNGRLPRCRKQGKFRCAAKSR